jgi:hypothetical protein
MGPAVRATPPFGPSTARAYPAGEPRAQANQRAVDLPDDPDYLRELDGARQAFATFSDEKMRAAAKFMRGEQDVNIRRGLNQLWLERGLEPPHPGDP